MAKKRVLVAYSASSTYVQTTLDYLTSLARHLDAEVSFVHVTHDAIMDFDLAEFDAIFHNYCARWPFEGHVSADYASALAAFNGPKILSVQDEYDRTNRLKAAIIEVGFDIVLTCIPQDQIEKVYPRADFPHVEFVTVLTGYVPDEAETLGRFALPLRDRPNLIGYRGRDVGPKYGRLGYDKLEIGKRMKAICEERALAVDIDWTEESRIYGLDWYKFVGSCRATLGSESGSNVFDFDGVIEQRFAEETERLGRRPTFEEFLPHVSEKDAAMDIGQISPRIFEAAALRTPMILFTGRYSDAVRPEDHYIELKKDFSNVEDVLDRLTDISALDAMADRAYAHLIASGAYSYAAFGAEIDRLIDRKLADLAPAGDQKSRAASASSSRAFSEAERQLLRERPTAAPAPSLSFDAKKARREAVIYYEEIQKLNRVIDDLSRPPEQPPAQPPLRVRHLISETPIVGPFLRFIKSLLTGLR